jgi:2-dehydro-3-deoxygalactonokinase
MEKFFSCDWGVSSFRLRIVETHSLTIIAEEKSDYGVAKSFELWKQSRKTEEVRLAFYLDIIDRHIKILEKKSGTSLDKIPLIISGMASSTIGMIHLPYKEFPFLADGGDLEIKLIETNNNFPHQTAIISGVKSNEDVMRGEETQLAGCFDNGKEEEVFIFPGTHSKHVLVKNGKAVDVNTYMTGEFFELLSKKSILSVSIEKGEGLLQKKNIQSFEKGVIDSLESNLLHNCFRVRTNDLFGKFTRSENYYYLSGLLVGTEIKELMDNDYVNVTLVSNEMLTPFYETAFNGLNKKKSVLKIQNADEALVHGQFKIFKRLFG